MINDRDTVDYLSDTNIQVVLASQVLERYISSSNFTDALITLIAEQNEASDTKLSKEELQIAVNYTDVVEQTRIIASRMLDRL
jgi:hypothetical protein